MMRLAIIFFSVIDQTRNTERQCKRGDLKSPLLHSLNSSENLKLHVVKSEFFPDSCEVRRTIQAELYAIVNKAIIGFITILATRFDIEEIVDAQS